MDDFFSTEDDDHFLDIDYYHYNSRKRPLLSFSDRDDYEEDRQKLYLVPYRWWKEVQRGADQIVGIPYSVSSKEDEAESEIILNLEKQEALDERNEAEAGVSGCEYALVREAMWLRTLKQHNDSKTVAKDAGILSVADNSLQDLFSLQIKLSVSPEANSLVVKIRSKDNVLDLYRRACSIFNSKSELFHIWDLSGQTSQFFRNEKISLCNGSPGQQGKEVVLELHVHGLLFSKLERNEEAEQLKADKTLIRNSVYTNGSIDNLNPHFTLVNSLPSGNSYRGVGLLGLTGLQNLGNTCFMNSAVQCLVHTPQLVDYFLGDYEKDINRENPLGMNGELALAFGELLRKLWAPGAMPVAPRMFKLKLADFAPQFSGYNQHDSQEFLAFLLDGLHEDLNRVKCKPYIEAKDAEGRPDEEVAEEYWQNHLARNDSVIVDVCQGQYRSTVVCPVCKKMSVTFDPFMYLTLPLPSTTMRTMTVTVFSTDGIMLPTPFTVTVPKYGRLKDLLDALSVACSVGNDEALLVAEIYKNKIFRLLDEPSDSLALIRDDDRLAAYRLSKDSETDPLIVFSHLQVEGFKGVALNWKPLGVPLVSRISDLSRGHAIRNQFLKLLNPFLMSIEDVLNDVDDNYSVVENACGESSKMEDTVGPSFSYSDAGPESGTEDDTHVNDDFKFCLVMNKMESEIEMSEPVLISDFKSKTLDVHVYWPDKMVEKYDTCLLSSLPQVFEPQWFIRKPQESVSLYKCLEGFLQEEPLGPDDMWYCPSCKKHREAYKKLDLWRLPEILVFHLKRFSYSRVFTNKLETYVDFPIDDLDLSGYISHQNSCLSDCYTLYAIINHYGGMGSGHYTAFVDHGHGAWYEFDDDKVSAISEAKIKTPAAYVLFYRRK